MVLIMSSIINGQANTRANVRTEPNGIRSKTTAAKSPTGIRQHSNISKACLRFIKKPPASCPSPARWVNPQATRTVTVSCRAMAAASRSACSLLLQVVKRLLVTRVGQGPLPELCQQSFLREEESLPAIHRSLRLGHRKTAVQQALRYPVQSGVMTAATIAGLIPIWMYGVAARETDVESFVRICPAHFCRHRHVPFQYLLIPSPAERGSIACQRVLGRYQF